MLGGPTTQSARPLSPVLAAGAILLVAGCATGGGSARDADGHPAHGSVSSLSLSTGATVTLCEHGIPAERCTRCHPELAAEFKKAGDWCGEHAVPESQCKLCHPDLTFDALPPVPEGADVVTISNQGEDVTELAAHAVAGKVTVFDFYADWCVPCRKVEGHMREVLASRTDVAVRKLNIVDWESALAARYLTRVPNLPYIVVFGRDGKQVEAISGLDIAALDAAIAEGASR